MTASITTRSIVARCPCWRGAIGVFAIAMMALGSFDSQPAHGQQRGIVQFPARPKPPATPPGQGILGATKTNTTDQMLLRAGEVNYDYVNERVSAIGNVQVYYKGTELEADQVIYDQKTKRMHAEGHIRLAEPDGRSRSPTSSIWAMTSAMASSIRFGSKCQNRPAWLPTGLTAQAGIPRFFRAASTPRASLAKTTRKSRRNGRSEPPGSSTIRARR